MITATEARKNVMAYCNSQIDDVLARLSDRIESASKEGNNAIRISGDYGKAMSKMIIKACRKKGYIVTSDCIGLIISWE